MYFLIHTLVHELGHAVDATTKQDIVANCNRACERYPLSTLVPYTSLQSYTYRDTFWKEKIAFDKIFKDTSKLGTKLGASRAYASTNEGEMFAECYALLMLGDCSSKDIILNYFPETFNLARKMLTEIHSKTDMERNNKY